MVKAYTTRVGGGPFLTECVNAEVKRERKRKRGREGEREGEGGAGRAW